MNYKNLKLSLVAIALLVANTTLAQHIPWSQLPEFLKYFMSAFTQIFTKWGFSENAEQMKEKFEQALEEHMSPEFFTYVRDFR